MALHDTKEAKPQRNLNIFCFLVPVALVLPAFFVEGAFGLTGLLISFITAVIGAYLLLFKPSAKLKQAAWSNIIGFVVAAIIFVTGAYVNLSGQSSPWLQ